MQVISFVLNMLINASQKFYSSMAGVVSAKS